MSVYFRLVSSFHALQHYTISTLKTWIMKSTCMVTMVCCGCLAGGLRPIYHDVDKENVNVNEDRGLKGTCWGSTIVESNGFESAAEEVPAAVLGLDLSPICVVVLTWLPFGLSIQKQELWKQSCETILSPAECLSKSGMRPRQGRQGWLNKDYKEYSFKR